MEMATFLINSIKKEEKEQEKIIKKTDMLIKSRQNNSNKTKSHEVSMVFTCKSDTFK